MKAAVVRLDVGGQVFATSKETLFKCAYFEPFLEGRIPHAISEDSGGLFLDRSPELFKILLQYMRANTVPPQSLLRGLKHELLAECLFFGLPAFADYLRGEISPHDMRPQDREIRALERRGEANVVDVYAEDTAPQDPLDLQVTLLPSSVPRAQMMGDFADFKRRFGEYIGGIADKLRGIDGLVFAGGSVAGAMCGCGFGDIDIFLCCNVEDAREKLSMIYTILAVTQQEKHGTRGKLLVTRSKHAVTIFQPAPDTSGPPPIQVVLSVYTSVKELLQGFDVDSCCFAYEPKQDRVWATQRGLRALQFGVNLADSAHDGGGYTRRLEKYEKRGFKIAVPGQRLFSQWGACIEKFKHKRRLGLMPSKLSATITREHIYLESYDVLLRPESTVGDPGKDIHVPLKAYDGNRLTTIHQKVAVTAIQTCQPLRGFDRLCAMHYGKLLVCHGTGKASPRCTPVRIEAGKYTVLWNARGVFTPEQGDDDDDDYSVSPQASVQRLLREHADHELEASAGTPQDEFEWWTGMRSLFPSSMLPPFPILTLPKVPGGAMQKFTSKPLKQCVAALREVTAARFYTAQHLQFVYDIVSPDTSFDNLKYVLDAARKPLSDTSNFAEVYGLPRLLVFKRAEARVSKPPKWWGVYE